LTSFNRISSFSAMSLLLPRPVPQTYRDTEVTQPDNLLRKYLFFTVSVIFFNGFLPNFLIVLADCDECAGEYEGDCPEHGPLNIIEDVSVSEHSFYPPILYREESKSILMHSRHTKKVRVLRWRNPPYTSISHSQLARRESFVRTIGNE